MAVTSSDGPRPVRPGTYRRITLAALAAQAFIVLTGAGVRLTGSGLGCSDWPRCTEERLVAPLEFHALVEFGNRLITFVVLATTIAAIWGARRRAPFRPDLLRWSLLLLAGIVAQVVLGGITVLTHLSPPVVMGHFLLSVGLLWVAVVLHHRAGHGGDPGVDQVDPRVGRLLHGCVGLALLVVVLGTAVTGTGPHGGDEEVERLGFDISEVTRLHAGAVWLFLAALVVTLVLARRTGAPARLHRAGQVVLVAVVAQGALGYVQYAAGVPVGLVILHVAGAVIVWTTTVWLLLERRAHPAREDHAGPAADRDLGTGASAPSRS